MYLPSWLLDWTKLSPTFKFTYVFGILQKLGDVLLDLGDDLLGGGGVLNGLGGSVIDDIGDFTRNFDTSGFLEALTGVIHHITDR